MAQTVAMIGIDSAELKWSRMLMFLLRHPDPVVPELTRQALLYLETAAVKANGTEIEEVNRTKYCNVPR